MGSVRTSTVLEEKIRRVAELKGISRSEVFRQALEIYCNKELTSSATNRWDDYFGVVDGPGDLSTRTREAFGEIMDEKALRSHK